MVISTSNLPWPLSPKLRQLLQEEIDKAELNTESGTVITFRDPDFSVDTGGFHPVEIAITPEGQLLYITDFTYWGRPPMCELAKELDFDFSCGLFQHFGVEYPIQRGQELFKMWQSNFLAYYKMDAYTVTVQSM